MNMKFIKTPLKGVTVQDTKNVGTRTVSLLMGEHAGEYVRGDIMDANAVIQAFDELKGNVDVNHDTLEELVSEIRTNDSESKQRDEEEKKRAEAAEQTITDAVAAETTRATAKEDEISDAITEINNVIDGHLVDPVDFNSGIRDDSSLPDVINVVGSLIDALRNTGVFLPQMA